MKSIATAVSSLLQNFQLATTRQKRQIERIRMGGRTTLQEWFYQNAPDPVYAAVASAYLTLHPNRRSVRIYPSLNAHWTVKTSTGSIAIDTPTRWPTVLLEKWTRPGFVHPKEGDVVMDVGARCGVFSWAVADTVDVERVIAVEPDPRNLATIRRTAAGMPIDVVAAAAWDSGGLETMRMTANPSGTSLVDLTATDIGYRGGVVDSMTVGCASIPDIARHLGHDHIDFLKIDAEGAERTVLDGLGDIPVRQIAVGAGEDYQDLDAEIAAVEDRLKGLGFEIRTGGPGGNMVYGRAPSQEVVGA